MQSQRLALNAEHRQQTAEGMAPQTPSQGPPAEGPAGSREAGRQPSFPLPMEFNLNIQPLAAGVHGQPVLAPGVEKRGNEEPLREKKGPALAAFRGGG